MLPDVADEERRASLESHVLVILEGHHEETLAERFPALTLRADHAHVEAYVHYGRASQLHVSRIALAVESMLSWARDRDKQVIGGLRLLYRAGNAGEGPDLDLSLPVN